MERVPEPPVPTTEKVPEPPSPTTEEGQLWADCLARLKDQDIVLWSKLHDVPAIGFGERGEIMLQPDRQHVLQTEALRDREVRGRLEALLKELNVPGFVLSGEKKVMKEEPQEDDRELGQVFKDEPKLQKILDLFDGEVLS